MRENLDAERQLIPALPDTDAPELSGMTGAAAIENGELIGFLCAPPPHDHAFGTAAKGIFTLRELDREEIPLVRELRIKLSDHLACSPCFMRTSEKELADRISASEKSGTRLFAAFDYYRTVAFIEVGDSGETYLTWNTGMKSICGAYCLPEYRGKGVRYLGVDLETMNPAAAGFWRKQFTFYTSGLTRRVDEKI